MKRNVNIPHKKPTMQASGNAPSQPAREEDRKRREREGEERERRGEREGREKGRGEREKKETEKGRISK